MGTGIILNVGDTGLYVSPVVLEGKSVRVRVRACWGVRVHGSGNPDGSLLIHTSYFTSMSK